MTSNGVKMLREGVANVAALLMPRLRAVDDVNVRLNELVTPEGEMPPPEKVAEIMEEGRRALNQAEVDFAELAASLNPDETKATLIAMSRLFQAVVDTVNTDLVTEGITFNWPLLVSELTEGATANAAKTEAYAEQLAQQLGVNVNEVQFYREEKPDATE